MLGNLLPDLHRGPLDAQALGAEVWRGVNLHRRTDAFTDTHPVFERSRARLREEYGHFAGVLVDIFYDHCLSVHWSAYHDQSLSAFIAGAYAMLEATTCDLAPRTRVVLGMLCREDWLTPYATIEGMAHTLGRLSARVFERSGRRVTLEASAVVLESEFDAFADDFSEFFPQLMAYLGVVSRKNAC